MGTIIGKLDDEGWAETHAIADARQAKNAQHSSKSNEHYTPTEVVEAARATMGGIDLDPASCSKANDTVKAAHYFSKGIRPESLERNWFGSNVFLNPPGGREFGKKGRPNSQLWWPKLVNEWASGRVGQAIFVGFSMEILQSAQNLSCQSPLEFPFCIPRKRLNFLDESGLPQGSPTHANVIVYLPTYPDPLERRAGILRFREAFASIGKVVVPA